MNRKGKKEQKNMKLRKEERKNKGKQEKTKDQPAPDVYTPHTQFNRVLESAQMFL